MKTKTRIDSKRKGLHQSNEDQTEISYPIRRPSSSIEDLNVIIDEGTSLHQGNGSTQANHILKYVGKIPHIFSISNKKPRNV